MDSVHQSAVNVFTHFSPHYIPSAPFPFHFSSIFLLLSFIFPFVLAKCVLAFILVHFIPYLYLIMCLNLFVVCLMFSSSAKWNASLHARVSVSMSLYVTTLEKLRGHGFVDEFRSSIHQSHSSVQVVIHHGNVERRLPQSTWMTIVV